MMEGRRTATVALSIPEEGRLSRRKSFLAVAACATALAPVGAAPAQEAAAPPAPPACPTALAAQALTGFEHGRRGFHVSTMMGAGSGYAYETPARTGAYALRVTANKSNGYGWFMWSQSPAPASATVRFALRLDSLPAANVTQLFGMDTYENPKSTLRLGYDASAQRLKLTLRSAYTNSTSTLSGPQVEAGRWYVVDMRWDARTAQQVAEWAVDGTSHGTASVRSYRAEPFHNVYLGTNTYDTFTARYDDLLMTGDAADYPVGDGRVRALRPNGTPSASSALRDDDGTAVDASSWQRLDDANALSTTDFVKQVTASSTAFARVEFEDTDATCIRAVRGHTWTHDSGKGTNNAKLVVLDGARESLIKGGDWAGTGTRDYSALVAPATVWTPEAVNALHARIGFSTDVSPVPQLDGVLLEYEEPAPAPAPAPDATTAP